MTTTPTLDTAARPPASISSRSSMTRWLVAKYIPDMRRREPINIGVIVVERDGRVQSRFVAETEDGVDGRFLSNLIQSTVNYKSWVARWRRMAAKGAAWEEFLDNRSGSNYYVEVGGETVVGDRVSDNRRLVDELFDLIVSRKKPGRALAHPTEGDPAP